MLHRLVEVVGMGIATITRYDIIITITADADSICIAILYVQVNQWKWKFILRKQNHVSYLLALPHGSNLVLRFISRVLKRVWPGQKFNFVDSFDHFRWIYWT